MRTRGLVSGGRIELDKPIALPEGTRVEVTIQQVAVPRKGSRDAVLKLVGTLSHGEAEALRRAVSDSTDFKIDERDLRLAEAINREARADSSSPYAGKYLAIADGKVVAVGMRLEQVLAELKKVVPDRNRGLVIEASADYDGPHEFWTERVAS